MFARLVITLLTAVTIHQNSIVAAQNTIGDGNGTMTCPQKGGTSILLARGSLEPLPMGGGGVIVDDILSRIPGSVAYGLVGYANTVINYLYSETDGALIARRVITDYINQCPGLPLVVLGGSQGAQVAVDSLIGQNVSGFPINSTLVEPLPATSLARVAALVLMGDPAFLVSEPFRVGNATRDGIFPRLNAQIFQIANLAARTQSYCNAGDPICAGGDDPEVHGGYVNRSGTAAADFVVTKVAEWWEAQKNSTGADAGMTTPPLPSATGQPPKNGTSGYSKPTASSGAPAATASPTATTVPSTGGAVKSTLVSIGLGMGVCAAIFLA